MGSHDQASSGRRQFQLTGSLADLDRAISAIREAVRDAPTRDAGRAELLTDLGNALEVRFRRTGRSNDLDEAVSAHTAAGGIFRDLGDPQGQLQVLNNLGTVLPHAGHRQEALGAVREAVEIRRRLAADDPDSFMPELAMSLNNLS
ncbi:tetratricopeptide repeat protein, partial [Streptomyces parvulus]